MGLISKIIKVGQILTENPNAVDEGIEKASNLKQNTDKIFNIIQEKHFEKIHTNINKCKNKLNEFQSQMELTFLKSQGKIYEDNY